MVLNILPLLLLSILSQQKYVSAPVVLFLYLKQTLITENGQFCFGLVLEYFKIVV